MAEEKKVEEKKLYEAKQGLPKTTLHKPNETANLLPSSKSEASPAEARRAEADAHQPGVTAKEQPKADKPEYKPKEKPHSEYKPYQDRKFEQRERPEPKAEQKPVVTQKPKLQHNLLLFNKWDPKDVRITDLSLSRYLNLDAKLIPHTFGKNTQHRFEKAELSVVERLVNKVMRSGQGKRKLSGKYIRGRGSCGKKMQALQIVEDAFTIIQNETKENPVQVLVKAIEFSAPREDITRIKRGGVSYTLSVDVAPLRRVDESLKNLALAGFGTSFNSKVSAAQGLARELIAASKEDHVSLSVKRRDEVERIAKASR